MRGVAEGNSGMVEAQAVDEVDEADEVDEVEATSPQAEVRSVVSSRRSGLTNVNAQALRHPGAAGCGPGSTDRY